MSKNEPGAFQPSMSLLVKLGSVLVHAEEVLSPDGHGFDKHAIETILSDPEVQAWRQQMDVLALLPKKR